MKKTLLLFCLLMAGIIQAQIVNIPDAAFKTALVESGGAYPYNLVAKNSNGNYFAVDANNDGEIQITEAQSVWELNLELYSSNIYMPSLEGLAAFTNLRKLYCSGNNLTSLDVSGLSNLERLACRGNELTSLNVAGLQNLEWLDFSYNNIATLNLSGLASLEKLICNDSNLITLDLHECPALKYLDCSNYAVPSLTSINLQGLSALEHLDVHTNSLQTLDITGLSSLTYINCTLNDITALALSGQQGLQHVECQNNNISQLNLANLPSLVHLDCNHNELSTLSIPNSPGLIYLNCNYNAISSVNLQGVASLVELHCDNNSISEFSVTGASSLEGLYLRQNNLTALDLTTMTSLIYLSCPNGTLEELNVSGLAELELLDCGYNNLTMLDVTNCTNLFEINCFSNNLESLDASTCVNLNDLDIFNNPIIYLNLKNGGEGAVFIVSIGSFAPEMAGQNVLVCVDEEDIQFYDNFIDDWNTNQNFNINSYCSSTPSGNYNIIESTLLFDSDNNGCNTADGNANFVNVAIEDGVTEGVTIADSQGNYTFYTQSGTFVVTPQFENDWFIANPPSATVSFADNNNNTSSQNFCVTANGVHPDVEVVLIPLGNAQPGFDANYKIVYRNKGNQTLSGSVTLSYEDTVLDFVSAMPTQASATTGSLIWNYSNLQPFEDREVNLVLNLNGPMETPPLEIDDELLFNAAVSPATGDETPADNSFAFTHIVTGAFDPNDITCLQGAFATPDKIGDYLHYNINFENTGNAAATFIVVKDVIDEAQFDVSSLQLLNASHDVEVRVEGNKVEFFFDDIELGAQEKGNVVFKIKTLNTLQVNDNVTQQANIYFDYNWPIETNEATTVFQVLGTGNFAMDESVSIYPNPAASLINIKASSAINSVELYDMQGRLLQSVSANDLDAFIDITGRASGMYVLKITTETGVKAEKIFKK